MPPKLTASLIRKLFLTASTGTVLCLAIGTSAWLTRLVNAAGREVSNPLHPAPHAAEPASTSTQFLVVAGGGAPSYNEIALEKNVLYFRRTLSVLGLAEAITDVFFANGNDGQSTVRYLNPLGMERFRPPQIADLQGAATYQNVSQWLDQAADTPPCNRFFYFTGHGLYNARDPDNNALILWNEDLMEVQDLATRLDALPTTASPDSTSNPHFVTMMAQCFAGSFANLIYEGGDPSQPVALQSRCGFFATVASRPSVGCTPAVNEADYRDYSSSFFAGLSGVDRVGTPVASADYNKDGQISYSEAHAFAKVDEETPDWPISTLEAWLQRQATQEDANRILSTPIAQWITVAEPQRQYVIESLAEQLAYDLNRTYKEQDRARRESEVEEAYRVRLEMELMNVGMRQQTQLNGSAEQLRILHQLENCEASLPN
ncbi:MAG: Caspase domain-containing protein [Cyanobacteria bacterium J06632_22]